MSYYVSQFILWTFFICPLELSNLLHEQSSECNGKLKVFTSFAFLFWIWNTQHDVLESKPISFWIFCRNFRNSWRCREWKSRWSFNYNHEIVFNNKPEEDERMILITVFMNAVLYFLYCCRFWRKMSIIWKPLWRNKILVGLFCLKMLDWSQQMRQLKFLIIGIIRGRQISIYFSRLYAK